MSSAAPSKSKKKGKQTLYTTKPNDDAIYCDVCAAWIDCSSGGGGNMQNHEKSNVHKENFDRKNPQLRSGPMDKFRTKRSSNTATPTAAHLTNTVPQINTVHDSEAAATSAIPENADAPLPVNLSADGVLALQLIESIRSLARALPHDVPVASRSDKLAVFDPPAPDPDAEDQCEHVGTMLHSVFDYNMTDSDE
ncbi:hypothetical protein AURDEDRAFT_169662 [Auricularia subglabra TFB-10046 SS5]|nr:hypothetical protein AURDEDRAFT_169662 [Auricularia subglabra TFB-10046 SS5]